MIIVQLLVIKAGGVIIPINKPRDRDMFNGQLGLIQEIKIQMHDGDNLSVLMCAVGVVIKRIVKLINNLALDFMLMPDLVDMKRVNFLLRLDLLVPSVILEVYCSWPVDNRDCIIILVV